MKQISTKRDKTVKIKNSDLDVSSDSNKIKLVNLAEEVLSSIAGTAPVLGRLEDNSITSEKYADGSIKRSKVGTSIGSMQDCIYTALNPIVCKSDTDIKIKFLGSDKRVFYKNVEGRNVINLTTTEYVIPTNYSLVYTLGDLTDLYVKNTDELTSADYILLSNHKGVMKCCNIKVLNEYNLNNLITFPGDLYYTITDKIVTLTANGDKRIFLKNGSYNFEGALEGSYDIPHNNVLAWETYSNTISVKPWNNLINTDVILIGNNSGKVVGNNLGVKIYNSNFATSNIVVYYAGLIYIEKNYGTTFSINFVGSDKRLFFKDIQGNTTCNLTTTKYTLDSNQSLIWDRKTNSLNVANTDTMSDRYYVLATNHKGYLKNCKLKIENANVNLGYKENCKEYTTYNNLPVGQGITIIDNYLLSFDESLDDHSTQATLSIIDLNTMKVVKTKKHNLGHVNSCDYNKNLDAMIIGNNTGAGQEIPPAIYIIYNAKEIFVNSNSDINFDTVDKTIINLYDNETYLGDYGNLSRPNACWGEHPNIVYLVMNDNSKVYRLFLGKGSNNLNETKTENTWGIYTETTTDRFNGTCKVINKYYNDNNFGVNQGIAYYKGDLYLSASHGKCLTIVYELLSNSIMKIKDAINIPLFDEMGNIIEREPEGIAIKDGKLYQTYRGSSTAIVVTEI